MHGRQCPCGRYGCMEAYAGRGAMEQQARKLHKKGHNTDLFKIMKERDRTRLTSGIWARALEQDDKVAVKIVDEAVEAIGVAVASALNVLDVDAVVIGGGLGIRLGEPYAKRIEQAMLPSLFTSARPPALRVASLGDLGGAIGAALLVGRRGRREVLGGERVGLRARGPAARAGACGPGAAARARCPGSARAARRPPPS